ncbi:class I SAM-dependent methyltransferase [Lentzea nigeriaca]|uniref:class I SAM-dependent methyltransferase n=1 Tax=Lentzea nigeriaca TaxID=1128665 RepID=UPI00195B0577|nr:class I SAM-dependent methyltransferase [Lentzea nigeriaca]MBM7861588.1 O-methyltransferase involved in polyketide biosynthesis [Lentzea nigeriaca]
MGIDVHGFSPVQWTALMTLYARALDSRRPKSVLHDTLADEVIGKIDYDFTAVRINSLVWAGAVRAKIVDDMTRRFVAAHPDAIVVDLGVGLDHRKHRVETPPTVDWYDVDFPEIIEARTEVFGEHPRVHPVDADVRGVSWLDRIPTERPAMIVGDGLVAWLSNGEIEALLKRLVAHFHAGEIAFNDYGRQQGRLNRWIGEHYGPPMMRAALRETPYVGFDDPHLPERWDARLKLAEEASTMLTPEVDMLPLMMRTVIKMSRRSEKAIRKTRVLRYRF